MKNNRSLAISSKIQDCKMGNIIGMLENEVPSSIFEDYKSDNKSRNRVFSNRTTLLTMVLSSVQQDKTLKNSVDLFYSIHQEHRKSLINELEEEARIQKELDENNDIKRRGRHKLYKVQIKKSLTDDISLNTAAYSKARKRLPLQLVENLFNASLINNAQNQYTHFHKRRVSIVDGTYLQMQDSEQLRELYEVKHKNHSVEGYPQGLLVVEIERGSGIITNYKLSNRHTSELASFYEMLDNITPGSLVLADDLYNCYEIFAKCIRLKIDILVPAKRVRKYEVIEILGEGDEIVRINAREKKSKWLKTIEKGTPIILRRIECVSPEGEKYCLMTTITDKKILKEEYQNLYLTRWDVEISIREIKTIMDINVLRSLTPEMIIKELLVSLATYNLIRKMIYASIKDLPFFPKDDFIQKYYTYHQDILIDKKGRVYNRWSSGRRRAEANYNNSSSPEKATE